MLTRELERLREEDRRREARLTALVTGLTRQLQAQQTNCAALEASVDELAEDLDRFRTSLQEFEQRSCEVIEAALKAGAEAIARLQRKPEASPDHDFGPGF